MGPSDESGPGGWPVQAGWGDGQAGCDPDEVINVTRAVADLPCPGGAV